MLVFFISLLSFSVGTFVGKQVSDSDHRRLALESEMRDGREVASSETEEGKDGKVSEKDVDNLAEEFVNKEKGEIAEANDSKEEAADSKDADGYKSYKHGGKEAKAEKSEKMEKTAKAEKTEKAEKKEAMKKDVAEKIANNEAATDGKAEDRKPTSALPGQANTSVGKFTVQVASYATEEEAKSNAAQLKTKGWQAFYIPATVGGKTWYRVSVGLFNNHKSAQAFQKDFLKDSGMKTAIVQKIVQ